MKRKYRKIVPVTLSRPDFTTGETVEETRHCYFTMYSYQEALKALGVDMKALEEAQRKAQIAGDPPVNAMAFAGASGDDMVAAMLYGALLEEAEERGETITLKAAKKWVSGDAAKGIADSVMEAYFTYLGLTDDQIDQMLKQMEDAAKSAVNGTAKNGKAPTAKSRKGAKEEKTEAT